MSANTVDYKGNLTADPSRLHSRAVWADCPILDIREGCVNGLHFRDDFQDFPLAGTQTAQIAAGSYKLVAAGGAITKVSIINSVLTPGGAMRFKAAAPADQMALAQAYPSYAITGLPANTGKLWFEASYAQNAVLTNTAAVMLGLGEVDKWTLAAAVPFSAGDAITNAGSFVGFRVPVAGVGVVDTVTSDRATSFTTVGAAEAGPLAAFTFRKFGLTYDPSDPEVGKCVRFFADGIELQTRLSKAAVAAFTNLDANGLGLILSCLAGSAGTTFEGYLKWWEVAQLLP